uniref:Transposon Ty3-I Gag-Pol polyprotein n=1 Tax=Cajanus cajan TaxID=3821 RepID=A0A151QM05_CAJCA|nr:Transposon Ty3-I Gag-Pol polyprotein [Cajanus cajan]
MKVDQIFTCHQVREERKVPLATLAFQGQAMYWWTTLVRERQLHNDPPIEYWNDLRSAMRRRHIPSYYSRELMDKLQRLQQKNMSVEEYRQKMELYLMRAGIREEERDLDDLVQLCIRVEQQHLRKNSFKKDKTHSTSYVKKDYKKEGHIASQCPNKKIMILRGQDIYSSHDESSSTTTSDSDSNNEDHQIENSYPYDGQLLMIRRLLGSQPNESHISQRENIFHTRCKISDKAYLTPIPHPKPYQLHWLNEDGDIIVDKQVKVKFFMGNYEHHVVCDIVLMEACHILLGRPWKFDKKTMDHGLTNEITFTHKKKKFVLHPLSSSQVIEDQKKKKENHLPLEGLQQEDNLKQTLFVEKPSYILLCRSVLKCPNLNIELSTLPLGVKQLLKEFDDVFSSEGPKGFPPFRGIEHQIDFVPGASLPNWPAYKTNPQETKEIEKQVQELLDKGWVQKSLSPCVVLVLLVPKKDGKWTLCCDCRAIINITIKYMHPIPRLDDMLDELHGANIFPKIDLKSGLIEVVPCQIKIVKCNTRKLS